MAETAVMKGNRWPGLPFSFINALTFIAWSFWQRNVKIEHKVHIKVQLVLFLFMFLFYSKAPFLTKLKVLNK